MPLPALRQRMSPTGEHTRHGRPPSRSPLTEIISRLGQQSGEVQNQQYRPIDSGPKTQRDLNSLLMVSQQVVCSDGDLTNHRRTDRTGNLSDYDGSRGLQKCGVPNVTLIEPPASSLRLFLRHNHNFRSIAHRRAPIQTIRWWRGRCDSSGRDKPLRQLHAPDTH